MLDSTKITDLERIITESDNCTVQYKSAEHFTNIQKLSDEYQRPVIRLYGIAGHGKGEVDHVGVLPKLLFGMKLLVVLSLLDRQKSCPC